MYTAKDIMESLKDLERLERKADECDAIYEQNPESEQAESDFDMAFRAQWNHTEKCVEMIREFSGNSIDARTARRLLKSDYRHDLMMALLVGA
jgi:hypothetical protein